MKEHFAADETLAITVEVWACKNSDRMFEFI